VVNRGWIKTLIMKNKIRNKNEVSDNILSIKYYRVGYGEIDDP